MQVDEDLFITLSVTYSHEHLQHFIKLKIKGKVPCSLVISN